ncbi:hypothetical protein KEM48_008117 [Puccinia striiformis f. sp. tritici PST-130]|nr:hypothetical protein KEM48_008117 [Puccinia striiformis f. sp. tritici PST-130]
MFARLAAPSVKFADLVEAGFHLCDGEERIPLGYSARLLADFLETLIGKSPFEIDLGLTADADSDVLPRRGLPSSNHLTLISDKPHGTRLSRSTKLDVKNIEFCGIHHHIQDEDVNWGATKGKEERHTREKAEAKKGRQRVYSEFLGLGTIDCFTAGIRAALNNLISSEPGATGKMRASATRRTIWISMVEVTSQQALFDRLQSNLLPILAQQLAILSDRLDPSALQKEPSSKLKCILELQAALEITLDQIATTLTTIVERNRTQSARGQRTNDQHNTELIRVDGLENYLTGRMFVRMRRVFEESDELIQQLRLSKKQCNHRFDVASIRER